MMYNYLKVIVRNFMNDRLYTVIIVLGLAVGLSCCLMIAQYIQFELSFDKDVKDREQIYYSYMRWESPEGDFDELCHPPVGPLFKESIPEVTDFVRIIKANTIGEAPFLRREVNGTIIFNERVDQMYIVDAKILTFFSIPLLAGNPESALRDPSSIVITKSLAAKLFPDENPLDKAITLQRGRVIKEFRVTAITEDPKSNSSIQYNALFSMGIYGNQIEDNWLNPFFRTFIKISQNTDPLRIEERINEAAAERLTELENKYNVKESIHLYPFPQIHFYRPFNSWGIATVQFTGDKGMINFFGILAILILIVSWANYINLTTARSIRRAKEVGLRKVNGASRRQIITQFLTEFLFFNIISVFLAFTIAQLIFPEFSRIIGSKAEWNFWSQPLFWLVATVFVILSTIASGLFPAFLISNYNPSKVLKGNFGRSEYGGSLRKGLVLVQFGVAAFMLMSMYVIARQMIHMQNKDIGMTVDKVLAIRTTALDTALNRATAFQQLRDKLQSLDYVKGTCAVFFHPGENGWIEYFSLASDSIKEQKAFRINTTTSGYPETMGIQLLHGKDFTDELYDKNKALVSETTARELGYDETALALGKVMTIHFELENKYAERQYEIIGIVKDFTISSKAIHYGRVILREYDKGKPNNYFLLKLSTHDISHTVAQLEKQWKALFPNSTFDYFFLERFFDSFYTAEKQFAGVFTFFSVIGILITCMGLFGLSLYNTTSRTKEIGIRKSLGGTAANIIWLFSKDYMKLVLTAGVLAVPISYWLLNKWLENYPYRIGLDADAVLIPILLMFCIAMFTVGYQTFKVAHMDPVQSLKSE